jgi:hypothetical protein
MVCWNWLALGCLRADGLSAEAADFAEVEHLQVEFEALQLVQVDLAGEQVGVLLQACVKEYGVPYEESRFEICRKTLDFVE